VIAVIARDWETGISPRRRGDAETQKSNHKRREMRNTGRKKTVAKLFCRDRWQKRSV